MTGIYSRPALKEWAVTLRALDAGHQILLLRKGGIREEGKQFRLDYERFYLYPTFEHQRPELLKPVFRGTFDDLLAGRNGEPSIVVSHFAEVTDAWEIFDQETLEALSPFHIWTDEYAMERLRWMPKKPLHVMLLRVYRLPETRVLPWRQEYGGCKSWIDLAEPVATEGMRPVLDDTDYARMAAPIRLLMQE